MAQFVDNLGPPQTAKVVWEKPNATDNAGIVPDVTCNPPSGTNFTAGLSTVTCEAVDGSGNTAECNFEVNVTGVYQSFFHLFNLLVFNCIHTYVKSVCLMYFSIHLFHCRNGIRINLGTGYGMYAS